jgi:hypothetical protein
MIVAIAGLEPNRFARDETGNLVRADIDHGIGMVNIRLPTRSRAAVDACRRPGRWRASPADPDTRMA